MSKLLIITGGSRGLGKSIVDLYLKSNWNILELSRSGSWDFSQRVDFSNPVELETKIKKILGDIDKSLLTEIHIISNAATLQPIDRNYKINSRDLITNFNINILSSTILLNQLTGEFRDLDIPKYIVNISSGAALKGYSGWSLYCASKAAMDNYINSIILQEEDERFPFTAINFDPGVMDTQMQKEIRSSSKSTFPTIERFIGLKENGELRSPLSVAKILRELLISNPLPGRYSVKDLDLK